MKTSGLLFLLVLLIGCTALPSLEKVQYSFLREHPDTTVLAVNSQLTNRLYAQFHIYYIKSGENLEHEDVWYYHHAVETWVAGGKESVR